MELTGTVTLDGGVEREIVWFFSRNGGSGAAVLHEELIIKGLLGAFAAWKICDGLLRLQEQGVAVPVSLAQNGFVRRCWSIDRDSWGRISFGGPSRIWTDSTWR